MLLHPKHWSLKDWGSRICQSLFVNAAKRLLIAESLLECLTSKFWVDKASQAKQNNEKMRKCGRVVGDDWEGLFFYALFAFHSLPLNTNLNSQCNSIICPSPVVSTAIGFLLLPLWKAENVPGMDIKVLGDSSLKTYLTQGPLSSSSWSLFFSYLFLGLEKASTWTLS